MRYADIVSQKKRWGVSALALGYRLHTLNLLGDWEYKRFSQEMGRRGRAIAPNPIEARERSYLNPYDVYSFSFRLGIAAVWEMPAVGSGRQRQGSSAGR